MSDVTRILNQIEHGAPAASEEMPPLVYDETTHAHEYLLTLAVSKRFKIVGFEDTSELCIWREFKAELGECAS
jgi:hypothetical protein